MVAELFEQFETVDFRLEVIQVECAEIIHPWIEHDNRHCDTAPTQFDTFVDNSYGDICRALSRSVRASSTDPAP